MAQFITRVELHKAAKEEDYNTLHEAMKKAGFVRTIRGSDGKTYHLPLAEYNRTKEGLTIEKALEDAKAAAATTKLKYAILVTESYISGPKFVGLDEVRS
jgi:hypothetical protein